MTSLEDIGSLLVYVTGSRLIIKFLTSATREFAFACFNIIGVYWFLYASEHLGIQRFVFCLILIGIQYLMVVFFARRKGWEAWIAFFTPIAVLVALRYLPEVVFTELGRMVGLSLRGVPAIVGISYMAFRCSRLVLEVRNNAVKCPTFFEYLNFALFLPTMTVGPINSYGNYRRGFGFEPLDLPLGRAALRILVGFVKVQFLGVLCAKLGYAGLLGDNHPHPWGDLPVAMVFYYLFLYCNFSGFCDMAIGAAGLIGIPVPENFQDPFYSRNMREFWNRWHITLSEYMRDIVFSPLSKALARLLGPERINLAVSLTILIVFLLIGIWHGSGWNYAVFGLLQGIGVIATHYYTLGLKRWLGRDGLKAYNKNPWIHAAAVVTTFCYYAMTLFFFANSPQGIRDILSNLK